jgi:hypothetical protein
LAEVVAELTLDVLLKWLVRRLLPRTSMPCGLLSMTLLLVRGSRGMRTTEIRPVLAVVPVAVGVPVATRTTSVMAKIGVGLLLGKMSIRLWRWYGH